MPLAKFGTLCGCFFRKTVEEQIINLAPRIRKVKCDEAKPECTRCQRSGRKCDGYNQTIGRPRTVQPFKFVNYMISGPSLTTALFLKDTQQRQAFEFYQLRSSLELSGPFLDETEIWNRLILQVAYHEVAIRYAVCALASFHQDFSNNSLNDSGALKTGLEQYSLGLQALVAAKPGRRSMEVTLIACVLFTSCEHLQGRLGSAKQHVDSGLKLLKTYMTPIQATSKTVPSGLITSKDVHSYLPSTVLLQLFKRLHRQLALLGQNSLEFDGALLVSTTQSLPTEFESIRAASDTLENLISHMIGLIEEATLRHLDASSVGMIAIRENHFVKLSEQLERWKIAFDEFLYSSCTCGQKLKKCDLEAVILLYLWYYSSLVFLQIDSPNEVMDYDRCNPTFEAIVEIGFSFLNNHQSTTDFVNIARSREALHSLAKSLEILRSKGDRSTKNATCNGPVPPIQPSYFSRKVQLNRPTFNCTAFSPLPPLFLVASRCRDPILRRHALRIMAQLDRRDGFWDSAMAFKYGGNVLDSEELAATRLSGQDNGTLGSGRIGDAFDIPVEARIMGVKPQFGASDSVTVEFLRS